MNDSFNYLVSEFFFNLNKYNALVVLVPLVTGLAALIGMRYKRFYEFITQTFLAQDNAMTKIRVRFGEKRKNVFDQKWTTYKEQRKEYNREYWDARVFSGIASNKERKELINLINELLEIGKNN